MKILHIFNHSSPQLDGYAIRGDNIVRSQAALGWTPVVLTSPQHCATREDDVETIDSIHYYRCRPSWTIPLPFIRQHQQVRQLSAKIREVALLERPDVLHAHSPCLWGQAAARISKELRIPMVYEVRGFWEDAAVDLGKTREGSLRYRLSRALETRVAHAAAAVVTIGEHIKEDLVERGVPSDKIFVVPNGVNADAFVPCTPDANLIASLGLERTVRVGYVGTLYPWEGVEDLVRAAPHIIAMAPDARILIMGGGTQASAIRDLIRDLNLSKWVVFVGQIAHQDINRYYSILDILVYPRCRTRNTELVTPLKPLEAMAMEKAILASDVGGLRELTGRDTALIFRSGDHADLAQQCLRLIQQPDQRRALGRRSRAYVLATRNWKELITRYEDVYAAAKHGPAAASPWTDAQQPYSIAANAGGDH
jgi:PEP-CTERM/exosortase A-associated glycosyltransferase